MHLTIAETTLDDATLSDRQLIRDELGIKTVIDLRTK
jgi:hypothetical protein